MLTMDGEKVVATGHRSGLVAMLLADSRLPSGTSAHSGGLEAAVLAGLDVREVPLYIETRLRTVAALDAAAAVLAHRAASAARPLDTDAFAKLDQELAARTPSEPMRAASRQLGRGLLRLAASVITPESPTLHWLGVGRPPFRAVALGAVGAVLGLNEAATAAVVCYEEAQSIASAALKLLPISPAVSCDWVLECVPLMESLVEAALQSTRAVDLPAFGAPQLEGWVQAHSTERRRLFVS